MIGRDGELDSATDEQGILGHSHGEQSVKHEGSVGYKIKAIHQFAFEPNRSYSLKGYKIINSIYI